VKNKRAHLLATPQASINGKAKTNLFMILKSNSMKSTQWIIKE